MSHVCKNKSSLTQTSLSYISYQATTCPRLCSIRVEFSPCTHRVCGQCDNSNTAFDTIDHSIILERILHEIKFTGTAQDWFISYLSDRFHSVHGYWCFPWRHKGSSWSSTGFGACLPLYIGSIIQGHGISFHCYVDDTQLYLSIKPDDTEQLARLRHVLKT